MATTPNGKVGRLGEELVVDVAFELLTEPLVDSAAELGSAVRVVWAAETVMVEL